MTFMQWTERLDTGVTEMNDEHRELIRLMNELYEMRAGGNGKPALVRRLEALVAYTVKHFTNEERYMRAIGFPELDLHAGVHAKLLKQLGEHREAVLAGEGAVPEAFFNFLQFWLSAHICGIDRKYGDFAAHQPPKR